MLPLVQGTTLGAHALTNDTVENDAVEKERRMDREHVKGAADKVKGAIKDTAGKLTGDKKLQSEGKFDKAKDA